MGTVKWTEDQEKAILIAGKDVLVSAAAGSGKTAVLVERVLRKLTDPIHPVDADRLLIVTFTRAAATQMKERIGDAIEAELLQHPEKTGLQKQLTLLHHADITTIDGFCLQVVRDHFQQIDLEPGFRVGEEAELKLLASDVMEEVLEQNYQEGKEDFLELVEEYSKPKTDEAIPALVERLYQFAQSYPDPEAWLLGLKDDFQKVEGKKIEASPWGRALFLRLEEEIKELEQENQRARDIAQEEDGPEAYLPALEGDGIFLTQLEKAATLEEMGEVFSRGISFDRLASIRKPQNEKKQVLVKGIRDQIKTRVKKMWDQYFYQDWDQMVQDMNQMERPMGALIDTTLDYAKAYGEAKAEKGLLDFSDIEHKALQILLDSEEVAKEYQNRYEEVLIDEYQDSNRVQDLLLSRVSRKESEHPNRFMVGDVKQSIYRFRLARPELFMEKYEEYPLAQEDSSETGKNRKILLQNNFRSRKEEVLAPVNFLFHQIMQEEMGKITYNEDHALKGGGEYPATVNGTKAPAELLLCNLLGEEGEESLQAQEAEATMVASRIEELVDPEHGFQLWDRGRGEYRPATYGDIVVLLRSMRGWSEIYTEVLGKKGIPAFAQTQTGYFGAWEVKTALSFLQVFDNPKQDIPMAAVLHSPLVGLTEEEMAILRGEDKKCSYYDCVRTSALPKVKKFREELLFYRRRIPYLTVYELLRLWMERTDFLSFGEAMPGGERRKANLTMLLNRAREFEHTGYRGLFHFNRYMEKLYRYQVDYGEADSTSGVDAVQIMSIHKSKGLEFPICIVGGMGKKFNQMDANASLVLHPDYGIGPDAVNLSERWKIPTLRKRFLQQDLRVDNLGEELRILYVAMTRAKEKLILAGGYKVQKTALGRLQEVMYRKEETLPGFTLRGAGSYLDWVLAAMARHPSLKEWLEDKMDGPWEPACVLGREVPFLVRDYPREELWKTELLQERKRGEKRRKLEAEWQSAGETPDPLPKTYREIEEKLSYAYPYGDQVVPIKVSVSELKKEAMKDPEEIPGVSLLKPEKEKKIPVFMQEKEKEVPLGAARGTLYHLILQTMDFTKTTKEEIMEQLSHMEQEGRLSQEERSAVRVEDLWNFFESPLGKRMKAATVHKEQPFVLGYPAAKILPTLTGDREETVLVQGIIDAYFSEGDGLILVDYKTDRVPAEGGEDILIRRYRKQLELYGEALTRLLHTKVEEQWIYSFALSKGIRVC